MLINFQPVQGELPASSKKKLPANMASRALNCDFYANNLRPVYGVSLVAGLSADIKTIYKLKDSWLSWPGVVNIAESFVHDSGGRIAFTGSGYPKETNTALAVSGTSYPHQTRRLGIDAPSEAIVLTLSGTAEEDADVVRTVSYVYTRVGKWSDGSTVESAPSYPTAPVDIKSGVTATLSGFNTSSLPGTYVTHFRIYRLNHGSSSSEYQFLKDILASQSSFIDYSSNSDISEDVLSTTHWSHPVENLAGLVSTTHGFMAAFAGNKVYFSEIYIPYAFPATYALPTDSDVVALGFNGSSVVAVTKTFPYLFVGQDPSTVSPVKVNYEQACVSARSLVNVPGGVIYATPDGLFFLDASGQGKLFTDKTFTQKQWEDLNPELMFSFRYNDSYLAFFEGSTEGIEFKLDNGLITRFSTGRPVYGGHYVASDDTLYLIRKNQAGTGREIVAWEKSNELMDYEWKSKTFTFYNSVTMAVAVIKGDFTAGSVVMQVYCDGVLSATKTVSNEGLLTWAPVRCNEVVIKFYGKATIDDVSVASSAMEIFK